METEQSVSETFEKQMTNIVKETQCSSKMAVEKEESSIQGKLVCTESEKECIAEKCKDESKDMSCRCEKPSQVPGLLQESCGERKKIIEKGEELCKENIGMNNDKEETNDDVNKGVDVTQESKEASGGNVKDEDPMGESDLLEKEKLEETIGHTPKGSEGSVEQTEKTISVIEDSSEDTEESNLIASRCSVDSESLKEIDNDTDEGLEMQEPSDVRKEFHENGKDLDQDVLTKEADKTDVELDESDKVTKKGNETALESCEIAEEPDEVREEGLQQPIKETQESEAIKVDNETVQELEDVSQKATVDDETNQGLDDVRQESEAVKDDDENIQELDDVSQEVNENEETAEELDDMTQESEESKGDDENILQLEDVSQEAKEDGETVQELDDITQESEEAKEDHETGQELDDVPQEAKVDDETVRELEDLTQESEEVKEDDENIQELDDVSEEVKEDDETVQEIEDVTQESQEAKEDDETVQEIEDVTQLAKEDDETIQELDDVSEEVKEDDETVQEIEDVTQESQEAKEDDETIQELDDVSEEVKEDDKTVQEIDDVSEEVKEDDETVQELEDVTQESEEAKEDEETAQELDDVTQESEEVKEDEETVQELDDVTQESEEVKEDEETVQELDDVTQESEEVKQDHETVEELDDVTQESEEVKENDETVVELEGLSQEAKEDVENVQELDDVPQEVKEDENIQELDDVTQESLQAYGDNETIHKLDNKTQESKEEKEDDTRVLATEEVAQESNQMTEEDADAQVTNKIEGTISDVNKGAEESVEGLKDHEERMQEPASVMPQEAPTNKETRLPEESTQQNRDSTKESDQRDEAAHKLNDLATESGMEESGEVRRETDASKNSHEKAENEISLPDQINQNEAENSSQNNPLSENMSSKLSVMEKISKEFYISVKSSDDGDPDRIQSGDGDICLQGETEKYPGKNPCSPTFSRKSPVMALCGAETVEDSFDESASKNSKWDKNSQDEKIALDNDLVEEAEHCPPHLKNKERNLFEDCTVGANEDSPPLLLSIARFSPLKCLTEAEEKPSCSSDLKSSYELEKSKYPVLKLTRCLDTPTQIVKSSRLKFSKRSSLSSGEERTPQKPMPLSRKRKLSTSPGKKSPEKGKVKYRQRKRCSSSDSDTLQNETSFSKAKSRKRKISSGSDIDNSPRKGNYNIKGRKSDKALRKPTASSKNRKKSLSSDDESMSDTSEDVKTTKRTPTRGSASASWSKEKPKTLKFPSRMSLRNVFSNPPMLQDDPCTCLLWDERLILPSDFDKDRFPKVRLCAVSVKECPQCDPNNSSRKRPLHSSRGKKRPAKRFHKSEALFTDDEESWDSGVSQTSTTGQKIRAGLTNEQFDTHEWLQSLLKNDSLQKSSSGNESDESSGIRRSPVLSWSLSKADLAKVNKPPQRSKLGQRSTHSKRSILEVRSKPGPRSSKPGPPSSRPGPLSSRPGPRSSKPGPQSSKPGPQSSKPGPCSSKLLSSSNTPDIKRKTSLAHSTKIAKRAEREIPVILLKRNDSKSDRLRQSNYAKIRKLLQKAENLVTEYGLSIRYNLRAELKERVPCVRLCQALRDGCTSRDSKRKLAKSKPKYSAPKTDNSLLSYLEEEPLFTDSEDEACDSVILDFNLEDDDIDDDCKFFLCDACGYNTTVKAEFVDHQTSCGEELLCALCGYFTTSKEEFDNHICEEESSDKLGTDSPSSRKRNSWVKSPIKDQRPSAEKYSIMPLMDIPGNSSTKMPNRWKVALKDTQENHIECELCGKMFSNSANLRRHHWHCNQKISRKFNLDSLPDKTAVPKENTSNRVCELCNKAFSTPASLTLHKWYCKQQTFSCHFCERKFSKQSSLAAHKRHCLKESSSHPDADEGRKNGDAYRCENCGESFNEFSELTDHMSNCSIQVEILPEIGNPNNEALKAQNELRMLKAQEEALKKTIKNRQNQLKNYVNPLTLRPAIEQISYQVTKKADFHRMSAVDVSVKKPGRSSNNQRASLETTASQSSSVDPSMTSATAYPTGLFLTNSSVDKNIKQCVICGKIFSNQDFLDRHMVRRHKDFEKPVESSSHGNPRINLPNQIQGQGTSQLQEYLRNHSTFVQDNIDHYNQAQEIRPQIFTNKRIDQPYIPNGVVEPAVADTSNLLSPMISDTQMNNNSINNNLTDLNVKEPSVSDKLNQLLRDGTLRGSQSVSSIKNNGITAEQVTQESNSIETVTLGSDEEEELWECDFCVKCFLTEGYLFKHIMNKHPSEWRKTPESNKRRVLLSQNAKKSQALPPEKEHVPDKRKTRTKPVRPAIVRKPSTETIESPSILTPFMSRIAFSKRSNVVLECTHCARTFVNATRLNYHIAMSHNI